MSRLSQLLQTTTKTTPFVRSYGNVSKPQAHFLKSEVSVGYSRLQDYYYDVVQPNLMLMRYRHIDDNKIEPPPTIIKPKFAGPIIGSDGKVIKKKGSIRPRKPASYPVGPFNIPELETIHIQTMVTDAITNKFSLLSAYLVLQAISGEKGTTLYSKSNVAVWKLRKGIPIGCQVTLQGGAMYAFLDKLTEVVLPRIKEWNGLKVTAGDGTGNLAIGFPPSTVGLFPDVEVIYDMIPIVPGFNIILNTSAYRNFDSRLLMSALQIPFTDKAKNE